MIEFQETQCLLISEVRVLLEAAEDRRRNGGESSTASE